MNKRNTSPLSLNMSNSQEEIDVSTLDLFSPEVITQLQFGDWLSLSNISQDQLEQLPDKATRALVTAISLFQLGEKEKAYGSLKLAKEWGCPTKVICRMLVSSVYNSLGRTALITQELDKAISYFEQALEAGTPEYDAKLLAPIRAEHQALHIGISFNKIKSHSLTHISNRISKYITQRCKKDNITDELHFILDNLITRLGQEGRSMQLDGTPVFNGKDPFMAGKIALGLSYWVTEYPSTDPITIYRCSQFGKIIKLVRQEKNESWGIYFYLLAIKKLYNANLIDDCFTPSQLIRLKEKLHWHTFVTPGDYNLRNKPNNFYQVAYAIAQIRFQLGWEDVSSSQALLDKMVDHYEINSGEYGFADETEGNGRYDRYSVLLIAEIAHRFREAGLPLTTQLLGWLRKSVDLVLASLNEQGDGFQYGRSIGAYGDTAFMEILSAAAWHGILTSTESKIAYIFCYQSTEKFLRFWNNPQKGTINLWENGRRTDSYRGKHRILGENISLLHQHLYVQQIWKEKGFSEEDIDLSVYNYWLANLPCNLLTTFHQKNYHYAVFTHRNKHGIFNLPLVNGEKYHNLTPYFPIPFSNGIIQSVSDMSFPQLIPKIILDNDTEIMPLCWYKDIKIVHDNEKTILTWEQDELNELGDIYPRRYQEMSVKTTIVFDNNTIRRKDVFLPLKSISIKKIELQFATFSYNGNIENDRNNVIFLHGKIKKISTLGYNDTSIEDISEKNYSSTSEKMNSLIKFKTNAFKAEELFSLSWEIDLS